MIRLGNYVFHMDHSPAQEMADKVAATILRSGRTKASVASAAGIPHTTFTRKINGHTEFTVGELLKLADVLAVAPSTFVPAALLAVAS